MNRIQLTNAQLEEVFSSKEEKYSQTSGNSCIHESSATKETIDMPTWNPRDLAPAELLEALSAIDPRADAISGRTAALDAWVTEHQASFAVDTMRARLDLLCECGECGTKGHTVPPPFDEEVKCVACFGHGVNAWTVDEAREARRLALELGTPTAMVDFHASVMRAVAARLIPASQVSDVVAVSIGVSL